MILKKIADFFKKFLSKLFKGNEKLEKNTETAIQIVDTIKKYIENPLLDIVVATTETSTDDKALQDVRTVLLEVSKKLGLFNTSIVNGDDLKPLYEEIRFSLLLLTDANKNQTLHAIAVIILQLLEKDITTYEANLFVAAKYANKKIE